MDQLLLQHIGAFTDDMKERSDLICGKAAVGGNYNSTHDIEGAIEYLLNHPETEKQMGENGRNYVLSEFSWEVIVKKYLKFFEEVIENREG